MEMDYVHNFHAETSDDPFRHSTIVMRCFVAPSLGLVGVLGNTLNIFVLGWRCHQGKLDMLERGAMYGLISLATSDLVFCLSIIPHAFFLENKMKFDKCLFQCIFQMYGLYVHDVSIKISTWVTVLIAMARYVVVCHPLRARIAIGTFSTKICLLLIHVFWVIFLLPNLWTYKSLTISGTHSEEKDDNKNNSNSIGRDKHDSSNSTSAIYLHDITAISWIDENTEGTFTYIDIGMFSNNQPLRQGFLHSWVIIGYFIPLVVLTFSNIYLIRTLRSSATVRERHLTSGNDVRRHVHMRQANSTITRTLVLLVLFFILLVSPSQIVGFYNSVSNDRSLDQLYRVEFLLTLSNVLVTLNFASHFFLYCTVSSSFRRTLVSMFRSLLGRILSLRVFCPWYQSTDCACKKVDSGESIKLENVKKNATITTEENSSRQINFSKPKEISSNSHLTVHSPGDQNLGSAETGKHRNSTTVTSMLAIDVSTVSDSRPASVVVE